jgi:hypothetical protein
VRMRDVLGSVIACTKIGLVSFVARLPHRKTKSVGRNAGAPDALRLRLAQ